MESFKKCNGISTVGPSLEFSELGQECIRDLIDSVDNFIFDCDGVLWQTDKIYPASGKLVSMLRKLKKKVYFITNNCLFSEEKILDKLKRGGIKVAKDELVFPTLLLCHHLQKIQFKGKIEVLGEPALKNELRSRGFDVNDNELATTVMNSEGEFRAAAVVKEPISAVMVDIDLNCNYIKVTRIIDILKKQNCLFFAGAVDRRLPVTDTLITAGPDFLLHMIKEFTGRDPEVLGKPSPRMFELLKERFSIDPDRTIFVGDSIGNDIRMSKICGLRSILVLTGSAKREEILCNDPMKSPDYISESVAEISSILEKFLFNGEDQTSVLIPEP